MKPVSSRPLPPLASHFSIGACVVGLVATACNFEPPSRPDPAAPPGVFISIDGSIFRPRDATIPVGGIVTFGTDTAPHEIYSDPHPGHTGCPGLNIGPIPRLSSRASPPLTTPGLCGFHDTSPIRSLEGIDPGPVVVSSSDRRSARSGCSTSSQVIPIEQVVGVERDDATVRSARCGRRDFLTERTAKA